MITKIAQIIRNNPWKTGLIISAFFVNCVPILNFSCWESCYLAYDFSLSTLVRSEMGFPFTILSILANFIIILLVVLLVLLILKTNKFSDKKHIFLLIISLFIIWFIHYFVFYNYTAGGIYRKEKNRIIMLTESELGNLKTKDEVINYIKSQDNYVETVCDKTQFETPTFFIDECLAYKKDTISQKPDENIKLDKEIEEFLSKISLSSYVKNQNFQYVEFREATLNSIKKFSLYSRITHGGGVSSATAANIIEKNMENKILDLLDENIYNSVDVENTDSILNTENFIKNAIADIIYSEKIKIDNLINEETSTFFCNINEKIAVNTYYDCLLYATPVKILNYDSNIFGKLCFVDNQLRYIYVHVDNTYNQGTIIRLANSYRNKKLFIEREFQ